MNPLTNVSLFLVQPFNDAGVYIETTDQDGEVYNLQCS